MRKNRRNRKRNSFIYIVVICVVVVITYYFEPMHHSTAIVDNENPIIAEVTMLDVGQGESILMESDNTYVIYDGGGRTRSSYVVAYLQAHDIDTIQYMIVSHYDEDHIAGLIGILATTQVENIICPNYKSDTKIYESFMRYAEESEANVIHPSVNEVFTFGQCTLHILRNEPEAINENDRSIVVRMTCGNSSILLMGDGEEESETDLIASNHSIKSDVLVVGHHGSYTSTSASLLEAVEPSYAWISVGKDNAYGHPHETTLNRLKNANIQIYRTDLQKEVTMYITKEHYWFSEEPTEGD